MRILGISAIVVACVGGWMTTDALAQRGGASKALGNHYDFYASDGSWQYSGPGGTFLSSTSGMGLAADAGPGKFQLAGHRRGGCGCSRQGNYGYSYGYRPRSYGYRYDGGSMYGYYDGGELYGRGSYDDYYESDLYDRGSYSQQYGYRPSFQQGDHVVIVSPGAELMRGYDVIGFAEQGERLPVLKTAGPWIGTAVERNGQRIGGWILRDSVELARDTMYEQQRREQSQLEPQQQLGPQQRRETESRQQEMQPEFPQEEGRGQQPSRPGEEQPQGRGPY